MSYKLIAFDMDGTLLNPNREISVKNQQAIKKALSAGKYVAISTGRGWSEIAPFIKYIPDVRYFVCISGALVYDRLENKVIYENNIPCDLALKIIKSVEHKNIMLHILNRDSILEKAKYEEKIKKGNGEYKFMFRNVTKKVDSIAKYIEENPNIISKINLHHENEEDRADTRKIISNLDLELAYSEHFSLECTNKGVSKATGLIKLCEYLNINIEDTIAVGDAENDYAVLSSAGLSVAMGNAKESIKKICDVIVADNKNDGCAEAVEKYLLK